MEAIRADPLVLPGSVRLYRDDLEYILSVIREHSPDIEISDGEYNYSSLDELEKERGSHLRRLKIWSYSDSKSILLMINREVNGVRLTGHGRDEAFYLIRERLMLRRRLLTIASPVLLVIGFILAWIPPVADLPLIYALPTILTGLFCLSAGLFRAGMFSTVYLKRRHEHQNFWQRHEENWVRGLVGLVGAIVGGLIVYWLTKRP